MSSKSKKRYAKERKMMEQINEPGNNTEIEQSAQMEEDRNIPQIQANQTVDQVIQAENPIHPCCSNNPAIIDECIQTDQDEDLVQLTKNYGEANKKILTLEKTVEKLKCQVKEYRACKKYNTTVLEKEVVRMKDKLKESKVWKDKTIVLEREVRNMNCELQEYRKDNSTLKRKVDSAREQLEKKKKLIANLRETIKDWSKG